MTSLKTVLFRKTLAVGGLDTRLAWVYQQFGWLFFSKTLRWLYPLLLIVGVLTFIHLLQDGQFSIYQVANSSGLGLLVLILINAWMVSIHEGAHALTLKHYGLDVPRGGLIFYFGLPCFFVDATDAWMAPRQQRIAVALAGPYSTALCASFLAVLLILYPTMPGGDLLFKVALWGYVSVLINLYPLLEFDGYYILIDLLNMPISGGRLSPLYGDICPRICMKWKLMGQNRTESRSLNWRVAAGFTVHTNSRYENAITFEIARSRLDRSFHR